MDRAGRTPRFDYDVWCGRIQACRVFEEDSDNLFLGNKNRRSDWLMAIATGLTLAGDTETYRLAAVTASRRSYTHAGRP